MRQLGSTPVKPQTPSVLNPKRSPICARLERDQSSTNLAERCGIVVETSFDIDATGDIEPPVSAMKASPLALTAGGIALVALSCLSFTSKLIWNRTVSAPKGLYAIASERPLERGVLVAYKPDLREKAWLESNGFIGDDWPLLKEVAALEGDEVCRCGHTIWIDGARRAEVLKTRTNMSGLPEWRGCAVLGADDVFLLNAHPRSLDGRYFGLQKIDRIVGTAIALWTYGERVGSDSEVGAKREGGSEMGEVSRRARFKACPMDEANTLSAHPFSGDSAPEPKSAPVTQSNPRF